MHRIVQMACKGCGKDGYGCDRGLYQPRQGNKACSGAVEIRPFQAEKKPYAASEAEGRSGEAVKGNPTTVILRVDENK